MAGPFLFGDSARLRARMPYMAIAKRSIEAVLGKDPCGKHSLQVAMALLGNIW